MSFILNALKKSEHDRLVSQDKTLFNKISAGQEQKKKKTPHWLFYVVIVNIFFLCYFIWFFTKDNKAENLKNIALNNSDKIDRVTTDISKNTITHLTKVNPKKTITEYIKKQPANNKSVLSKQSVIKPNLVNNKISNTQSINSINRSPAKKIPETKIALNQKDVTTENTKLAISKTPQSNTTHFTHPRVFKTRQSDIQFNPPISKSPSKNIALPILPLNETDVEHNIDKNNSTVPKNPQIKAKEELKKQPSQIKVLINKPDPDNALLLKSKQPNTQNLISENEDLQQTKTISLINEFAKKDNEVKTNQLPFLSDLDYEFRRTVPDVKINVYVYSENKNKRFIMINMTKFVPGQEISEGMILNEIRMDSMVVDYDNRIFQINRN